MNCEISRVHVYSRVVDHSVKERLSQSFVLQKTGSSLSHLEHGLIALQLMPLKKAVFWQTSHKSKAPPELLATLAAAIYM